MIFCYSKSETKGLSHKGYTANKKGDTLFLQCISFLHLRILI